MMQLLSFSIVIANPFYVLVGGLILALIEGVGIAINRAVSEQYKPG